MVKEKQQDKGITEKDINEIANLIVGEKRLTLKQKKLLEVNSEVINLKVAEIKAEREKKEKSNTKETEIDVVENRIEENTKNAIAKAESIAEEDGKEEMENALEPIEQKVEEIKDYTEKKIAEVGNNEEEIAPTNPDAQEKYDAIEKELEGRKEVVANLEKDLKNKSLEKIQKWLAENPEITTNTIQRKLNISNEEAEKLLTEAKELTNLYSELEELGDAEEDKIRLKEINKKLKESSEEDYLAKPFNLNDNHEPVPLNFEIQNEEVLRTFETEEKGWFGRQTERVGNAFSKGVEWWNNLDNDKNGKLAKTIVGAGLIGASIFGIGEFSGLNEKVNSVNKIWIRSAMAGLMSSIMTHKTTGKVINNLKENWGNANNTTKALAVLVGLGAGAGIAISFVGTSTLIVTGTAIATKLGLNKYVFDKKIEEINFDINALVGSLDEIEKQREELNKKLNNTKMWKSVTNGAISIASGFGSMIANQIEFKIDNNVDVKNSSTPIEQTPEADTTVAENKPIEKGWWGRQIDKIKSIGNSKEGNESTGSSETATNSDNNPTEGSNDVENSSTDTTTVAENTKTNQIPATEGGKPVAPQEVAEQKVVNTENMPDRVVGEKIDIKEIKAETIIDGEKNVGISYAHKASLLANKDLTTKLGIDYDKFATDEKYAALEMKKIEIKLGYMDKAGNQILMKEDAIGKISYDLDVDKDGKLISYEIDKDTGVIRDVHHEGDTLEKDLENYEETKLNKTYANIEKAFNKSDIEKPEGVISSKEVVFSNSYLMGDDDSSYLENNLKNTGNTITKPDEVVSTNIMNPGKIPEVYNFENIIKSPEWRKLNEKGLKDLLELFNKGGKGMNPEELRFVTSVDELYKKAIESSGNSEDFQDFMKYREGDLNVINALKIYKDVIDQEGFTEQLKTKYGFYDWKDSLAPNIEFTEKEIKELNIFKSNIEDDKELKNLFKTKYGKDIFDKNNLQKFMNTKEMRNIYAEYNKNLNYLDEKLSENVKQIVKNSKATNYIDENKNILTDYLKALRIKLGADGIPRNERFRNEKMEEYLQRVTAVAKIKRINIDPKFLLTQENLNPNTTNHTDDEPYNPNKK